MRELTKSMVRLSWAMSAFGLEQMRQLVKEEDEENPRDEQMARSCDDVASAMDSHLSGRVRSLYESGDRFQREMIDFLFDLVGDDDLSPRAMLDRAAEIAEKSARSLRRAASEADDESVDEPVAGESAAS